MKVNFLMKGLHQLCPPKLDLANVDLILFEVLSCEVQTLYLDHSQHSQNKYVRGSQLLVDWNLEDEMICLVAQEKTLNSTSSIL
jgi:hypothetical protein